jgi:hypothetical protein
MKPVMFVSADAIYQSWMSDSISYRFAEQGAKELTWLVVIDTVNKAQKWSNFLSAHKTLHPRVSQRHARIFLPKETRHVDTGPKRSNLFYHNFDSFSVDKMWQHISYFDLSCNSL